MNQQYGSALTDLNPLTPSEQQQIEAAFDQQQHLSIERDSRADQRQAHQKTFAQLQQQADTDTSSGMSLKWLVAGVGVVLVALFALSGVLKTIGGILGIGIAAYGIFKPIISGNQQSAIDSQLALLSSQLDEDRQQLANLDQQLIDADAQVTRLVRPSFTGFAPERWLDLQLTLVVSGDKPAKTLQAQHEARRVKKSRLLSSVAVCG